MTLNFSFSTNIDKAACTKNHTIEIPKKLYVFHFFDRFQIHESHGDKMKDSDTNKHDN